MITKTFDGRKIVIRTTNQSLGFIKNLASKKLLKSQNKFNTKEN